MVFAAVLLSTVGAINVSVASVADNSSTPRAEKCWVDWMAKTGDEKNAGTSTSRASFSFDRYGYSRWQTKEVYFTRNEKTWVRSKSIYDCDDRKQVSKYFYVSFNKNYWDNWLVVEIHAYFKRNSDNVQVGHYDWHGYKWLDTTAIYRFEWTDRG